MRLRDVTRLSRACSHPPPPPTHTHPRPHSHTRHGRRRWRSSRRCCAPGTAGFCVSWTTSSPSSGGRQPRCWAPATCAASPWVRRCRCCLAGWLPGCMHACLVAAAAAAAVGGGCTAAGGHPSKPHAHSSLAQPSHPTITTHTHDAGVENAYYEGPLRLRLPVAMQLDADGAFSFEAPLPSPEGALGQFVDGFKALVIPSHLRPPAQVGGARGQLCGGARDVGISRRRLVLGLAAGGSRRGMPTPACYPPSALGGFHRRPSTGLR